jgi:hypothetical protein
VLPDDFILQLLVLLGGDEKVDFYLTLIILKGDTEKIVQLARLFTC